MKLWTVWKHIKEGKCNCVGKVEGWLEEEREGGEGIDMQYCHQGTSDETVCNCHGDCHNQIVAYSTCTLQTHTHFRASPSLHYYHTAQ